MRNTLVGLVGLLVSQLVSFAAKSVFVRLLGAEYNGVNGLFSNILQVLNLAELGFATSVAFALYKPLKEHDEQKQAELMHYFANIYRVIAVVVAVAGCCCIPFLQYLIAEDISQLSFSIGELRGYFAMYLVSTVCSYLLAYKRTLITADQNNYIVTGVDNACNIMLNLLQIALLYVYKNFYAYLAIMIAKTIINNLILHLIANKKYAYLKKYKKARLPKEEKRAIFQNVEATFLHRLGDVASRGTSSIIISSFVSLIAAGQYSNYAMVTASVGMVVNIIFTSITASIGDLCASESEEVQYKIYKRVRYLAYFCGTFTLVCFIGIFNPFIELWVGKDMVMPMAVVVALSFDSSKWYFRKAILTFKDAKGMFRNDWYKPILEAVAGIALGIGLSFVWGTLGVILGHIIATMLIAIPIETVVFFKQGIKKPLLPQFLNLAVALLFAFALSAATYFIASFIPSGIGWFVLRFVFVVVFAAGVFLLVTCRTPEFKYYKELAIRILRAMFAKLKGRKRAVETAPSSADSSALSSIGDEGANPSNDDPAQSPFDGEEHKRDDKADAENDDAPKEQ